MRELRKYTGCQWVLFAALSCYFVSGIRSAVFDATEVTRVIEETLACYNNPGLTVSVVKDGKTILSRGFGVKDVETKEPVSADTVFGLASVSKSFAATLLVKLLYEKTNLTVDSRVQELLGDKFQLMDEFRSKEATFADLMAHRMAIPSHNRLRFDSNLTRESIIERLALLPTNEQFRVKHIYSNLVYGLVTYLAEVIGEDTWENLVSEHLLKPLGMKQTTFSSTADLNNLPNKATGYLEFGGELSPVHSEFSRKWALLAGSGAVMSTADDMVQWMNFHLRQGRGEDGGQIMAVKHMEEVHKPRMLTSIVQSVELREPQFPVAVSQGTYAHGLRRGYYRGYDRIVHTGSTLGYKTLMSLLPDVQLGVFIALTGEDSKYTYRSSLQYYLMDWALGMPDSWLNATTICSFPEPWRSPEPKRKPPRMDASLKPALNISLFEGTYHNKAYGYLQVHYSTLFDKLLLDYGWGSWQMFYQSSDSNTHSTHTFFAKGINITAINLYYIEFVEDVVEGEDMIIGLRSTAFDSKHPPVFEKLGLGKHSQSDSAAGIGLSTCMLWIILFLTVRFSNVF
ncbi:penicillin-binding protein 4 [Elysia marginata]|uniref:Penicillin-binding protein 4 n=1 Tax=Elysia marginata TaxID=1093978 RepID=A0AAV4FGE9_9GAST|nr:penicillin-binding protein 4 [Elysia marginata]